MSCSLWQMKGNYTGCKGALSFSMLFIKDLSHSRIGGEITASLLAQIVKKYQQLALDVQHRVK